jgi:hypothetical protein
MANKTNVLRFVAAVIFALLVAAFFIPQLHVGEVGVKLTDAASDSLGEEMEKTEDSVGLSGFPLAKGLISNNIYVALVENASKAESDIDTVADQMKPDSGARIIGLLLFLFAACSLAASVLGFLPMYTKRRGLIMAVVGGVGFVAYCVAIILLTIGVGLKLQFKEGLIGDLIEGVVSNVVELDFNIALIGWIMLGLAAIAIVLTAIAMISARILTTAVGWIVGMSGMYAGVEFPIESGEEIVIGRDAALSHIVVNIDAEKVSRQHVGISVDESTGMYTVVDYSSNGTYENNGNRLASNTPVGLEPGSLIYLAKPTNSFMLS